MDFHCSYPSSYQLPHNTIWKLSTPWKEKTCSARLQVLCKSLHLKSSEGLLELIDNYLRWSTSLAGKTPLMNGALRQKVLKKEKLSFIESRGAKYMYCKPVREKQRRVLEFYFGKRNFQIKELEGIDQLYVIIIHNFEFMKSKRTKA